MDDLELLDLCHRLRAHLRTVAERVAVEARAAAETGGQAAAEAREAEGGRSVAGLVVCPGIDCPPLAPLPSEKPCTYM